MDGIFHAQIKPLAAGDAGIAQFALRVVSQIAGEGGIDSGTPRRDLLQLLVRFARGGDPAVMERLFVEMKRQRVSAERMVDVYIPAAVGEIGTAWHLGELDILQATVGTARIQHLLRELGRAWAADIMGPVDGARVLVIVPVQEQHSLGAMIAVNQMRRLGVSVCLQLQPPPAAVTELVANRAFDAVFISVANRSRLESCRQLVKTIRGGCKERIPIAIGGPLVELGLDAVADTGADIITSSVTDALAACGLLMQQQAAQ
jgi:methylmalonyl-CoA mutase cobalamin-binding subunit